METVTHTVFFFKQAIETLFEGVQMLTIADFKAALTNIFKESKEIMLKELKEGTMITPHQRENIKKEKLQKRNK